VDSVSRQLRVIPPTRKEFKIDTGTKVRLDRVDKTGRQIHLQTDRQTDREACSDGTAGKPVGI
jgi:hypothetical protein